MIVIESVISWIFNPNVGTVAICVINVGKM